MLTHETALQRTGWHLAALRVELKLLRLQFIIRAYNPGQPRVSAGRPDGGQWTSDESPGAARADDDARVILVGNEGDQRYKVDLMDDEGPNGHTIDRHVGKSDAELFQRVQDSQWRSMVANGEIRKNGGFDSLVIANDPVHRTIEAKKNRCRSSCIRSRSSQVYKEDFRTQDRQESLQHRRRSCLHARYL